MDWNEFLHEAIAEKDADLVRQALAEGADPNHADNAWDDPLGGRTGLYWAVSAGDLEIVRLLLAAGAKVAAEAQGRVNSYSLAPSIELRDFPDA